MNALGHLPVLLGHSQCKTLSQSPRQLITYYLWYFADVALYLLKKEVEKIRLQVLFRLVSMGFLRVSCTLNMLMWRYINEERDDKSFMGVERVSSP